MSAFRPYTGMTLESEVSVLRRLHGMIENDDIASREAFGDMMKASFEHCRLDSRRLSDDLGYSYTTVYRWIEARSAPHPSLWPRVIEWVLAAIDGKIAEHECVVADHAHA